MKTLIIPGYGDHRGYIDRAVRNWDKKYGMQPEVHVFGWQGDADTYEAKWQDFDDTLQQLGEVAIIGISAGASVGLRALQMYPNKITKVITVCGLVNSLEIDAVLLHSKYPVLERSLESFSQQGMAAKRVMTMRPVYDEIIPTKAMLIESAVDVRMPMLGHMPSILCAMYGYGKTMASFIQS